MKNYYVYILSNPSGTLYTGMTNNLERRLFEHKNGLFKGFTAKYKIFRLVYFEISNDAKVAIAREKQIKGWLRSKKLKLIKTINPKFEDLSRDWTKT
jgi:putative endonuclease